MAIKRHWDNGPSSKKKRKTTASTSEPDPAEDDQQEEEEQDTDLFQIIIPPAVVPQKDPEPSPHQLALIELIECGANVVYSGCAGTGKSLVARAFIKSLREMGHTVTVVAPTGKAALDIGGCTTWSFAGWTPDSMKKSMADLIAGAKQRATWKRLHSTTVLVVDEVSMFENWHFERLHRVMRSVKDPDLPFGGVQVIVAGDFHQLPPVKPFGHCIECGREMHVLKSNTVYKCPKHEVEMNDDMKWAFESDAWKKSDFVNFQLTEVHRQTDPELIRMLAKIRINERLTSGEFNRLLKNKGNTDGAVRLCSTKNTAREVNKAAFRLLADRQEKGYTARDSFKWNEDHDNLQHKGKKSCDGMMYALSDHSYEPFLELKIGEKVVLQQNISIPRGLVNGSQGIIIDFVGFQYAADLQASTKNPGPSYGANDRQERNAAYSLPSKGGDYCKLRSEEVKRFMANPKNSKMWPLVRFHNGEEAIVQANCAVSALGDTEPYSLLSRTQVPLIQGDAMTIHKSQGMTLDRAIVDCDNIFEEGQLYTAISRIKTLDGLKLVNFSESSLRTGSNEKVRAFYKATFGDE